MRMLLVAIAASIAVPAVAETRTWTIAKNVVTTEAELVAVRGDRVYLKVGDEVEGVPLARLSAADQAYIASLALAPAAPETANEVVNAELSGPEIPDAHAALTDSADDIRPLPGEERSLIVPTIADTSNEGLRVRQAVGTESLPSPPSQAAEPWEQFMPTRSITRAPANSSFTPNPQQRIGENRNDRRFWRQPPPEPGNRATNGQRNDDEEPRGLFRGRRYQRQRANSGR